MEEWEKCKVESFLPALRGYKSETFTSDEVAEAKRILGAALPDHHEIELDTMRGAPGTSAISHLRCHAAASEARPPMRVVESATRSPRLV